MCTFCENITNKEKQITWNVRSIMADDNICEFVNDKQCSVCGGCRMYFTIYGYNFEDDSVKVGIDYNQYLKSPKGEEVIIRPFSETVQFNYCPFCGKQISKTIKDFDKNYAIEIDDN